MFNFYTLCLTEVRNTKSEFTYLNCHQSRRTSPLTLSKQR